MPRNNLAHVLYVDDSARDASYQHAVATRDGLHPGVNVTQKPVYRRVDGI